MIMVLKASDRIMIHYLPTESLRGKFIAVFKRDKFRNM